MVYAIGASSPRRAVDKKPTTLRKTILGKIFAVPGLSLHPTAKNLKVTSSDNKVQKPK